MREFLIVLCIVLCATGFFVTYKAGYHKGFVEASLDVAELKQQCRESKIIVSDVYGYVAQPERIDWEIPPFVVGQIIHMDGEDKMVVSVDKDGFTVTTVDPPEFDSDK